MAITRPSGFPHYGSAGTNAVTIVNAGDLMIAAVWTFPNTDTVTSVTSTRVPTWTNAVTLNDTTNGIWVAIWTGVAASAGADTITYNVSATPSFVAYGADSLTETGASWSMHVAGSNPGTTGTTLTWPSLTSGDSNSAYWGFCTVGSGTLTAGSTSGFTYTIQGTETAIVLNPGLTSGSPYQPTMPVSTSTDWDTVGMIVSAGAAAPAPQSFVPKRMPSGA